MEAIPSKYQLIVILLYTITALFALFSNVFTIVVLLMAKKTSPVLSKYLITLSVSDIIMATFSMPFSYTIFMYGKWLFHPAFCPVVLSIHVFSVFVSIYILIAIGIDRYYAIVRPLDRQNWLKNFPRITIAIICMSGLCLSLTTYYNSKAVKFTHNNRTHYDCRETWDNSSGRVYTIVMFCVTFAVPVAVLVFVYSRMAYAVCHREFSQNLSNHLKRQKIQVIRLLIIVVIAFILCWTGIQTFSLIVWLFPNILKFNTRAKYYGYVISYLLLHWISMFHSTVNPIVYSFFSDNFRSDLKSASKRLWLNKRLLVRFGPNSGSKSSQTSQKTLYTNISLRSDQKDGIVDDPIKDNLL
ncbi:unnamed protein product [Medioppia subpectinata]|uniref:G-protein coupled receptors family 1 profile domain-containing protein n=1 Tax=Medioppia subpectinata TaxID=1979941 RepID=A0A7R9L7Y2_9ACAR|nr:unnamed protein product [Medioppia subpectinata]CAG2116163.1 unnamed protein product [Medioppia subpectinata]